MFESAEAARLAAARNGDQHAFGSLIEPYQRELQVHCYRLLGSLQDAEDLVQETLLRAWRRIDSFEGRASFRAWLYKIATNACFDTLDKRRRRDLPHTAGQAAGPGEPMAAPLDQQFWLEPLPSWYRGQEAIAAFLASTVFGGPALGRGRLRPTKANARPAFALYQLDDAGETYRGLAIQVLTIDRERLAEITIFINPALFARFGLPAELDV